MGIAIWAAFRQIEALRESVAFTLEDGAIQWYKKLDIEGLAQWLSDQGVTPIILTPTDSKTNQKIGEEQVNILISMKEFLMERYPYAAAVIRETCYTKYGGFDFGVHRSGVGWHSLPNFVITSAFVRLLGASEQFELDVLKSLLYYRPAGKAEILDECDVITVRSDVLTEESDEFGYSKPSIWTWIKKSAENNIDRKTIFKRVYGIETTPTEFNALAKSAINQYRTELYEKRNAIAHGRANVTMLLSDYCTAEIFILETIRTISQQCIDKFKLIV
ncbi:hypothetical protein Nos7524_3869 [Nostoc sp. PCC 7524]|uniref:hypothetical protein n=1 Tax=Nostoc sp. (strain ATCC 29411 / PCC 7524) TaxID=28072 RepID=UPI00029F10DD|nr:hypothetical protein [Nostoc sp. PCC 7524]AFY49643.1 hypothetical protein Nos7524_3869 [Nostoc sp. PCC 7524]